MVKLVRLGGSSTGILSGPRLSDAGISFDAALAGQGVALVNGLMAADELANGRLVECSVAISSWHLLSDAVAGASAGEGNRDFRHWLMDSIARSIAP